MFLKDVWEYCHSHVFAKSEDKSLFLWFKQYLQWKADLTGHFYVSAQPRRHMEEKLGSQLLSNKVKPLLFKEENDVVIQWMLWEN